jgi:hypothetical protein
VLARVEMYISEFGVYHHMCACECVMRTRHTRACARVRV